VNYPPKALLFGLVSLASLSGCGRSEVATSPKPSLTELLALKSDDVAALTVGMALPEQFVLRLDNMQGGARLDVLALPRAYDVGTDFTKDLPLICSVEIQEESVSLTKGKARGDAQKPLSTKVARGFIKWHLTSAERYSWTEHVRWHMWEDRVSFIVSRIPMQPDAYFNAEFDTAGRFLGLQPGGG
jgi:hypothetical protein